MIKYHIEIPVAYSIFIANLEHLLHKTEENITTTSSSNTSYPVLTQINKGKYKFSNHLSYINNRQQNKTSKKRGLSYVYTFTVCKSPSDNTLITGHIHMRILVLAASLGFILYAAVSIISRTISTFDYIFFSFGLFVLYKIIVADYLIFKKNVREFAIYISSIEKDNVNV